MTDNAASNYKMAGLFLVISGILHLPIPLFAGFGSKPIFLAVTGVVWIVLGLQLRKQNKYLPCLVYVFMLIGMIASMASLNAGVGPNWLWWMIFIADLIVAVFLFRLIWSKEKDKVSQ